MTTLIAGLSPDELLARLLPHRIKLDSDCWDWDMRKSYGYGAIKIKGRQYRVTRLICAIYHGLNLEDSSIYALHKLPCSNESCWNPEHLYLGSHKDNQADRSRTITHCKNGHALDITNTYRHYNKRTNSVMRGCRQCKNAAQKRYMNA